MDSIESRISSRQDLRPKFSDHTVSKVNEASSWMMFDKIVRAEWCSKEIDTPEHGGLARNARIEETSSFDLAVDNGQARR